MITRGPASLGKAFKVRDRWFDQEGWAFQGDSAYVRELAGQTANVSPTLRAGLERLVRAFCDPWSWVGLDFAELLECAAFFAGDAGEGWVEAWHGVAAGVFEGGFGVGLVFYGVGEVLVEDAERPDLLGCGFDEGECGGVCGLVTARPASFHSARPIRSSPR
jgi:hypothetical protein